MGRLRAWWETAKSGLVAGAVGGGLISGLVVVTIEETRTAQRTQQANLHAFVELYLGSRIASQREHLARFAADFLAVEANLAMAANDQDQAVVTEFMADQDNVLALLSVLDFYMAVARCGETERCNHEDLRAEFGAYTDSLWRFYEPVLQYLEDDLEYRGVVAAVTGLLPPEDTPA